MQKQIEAYENDLISADDLKQARERVESERLSLHSHLDKLENQSGDPRTVKHNAEKFIEDITGDDRVKAKHAIRILIDHIVVENEQISITWKS
ncbi:MAG: hypothetical protein A2189_07865 [Paenibacillus sp. RIFOXYA1_FULL_44_5]|nr:MAG: hypothetical protein A2189_07865 [Paenibacillus sp. RIFOXYA1_FULL_44_5]